MLVWFYMNDKEYYDNISSETWSKKYNYTNLYLKCEMV